MLIAIFIQGCSYSFTGASVPPHLKTIAILPFNDRSSSGEPNLQTDLMNELIQKFIDDNSLQLTDKKNADALLEGTIKSLRSSPIAVTAGESVNTVRVKIIVDVTYRDLVKKEKIFEKSFNNYGDYENSGDITTARSDAIVSAIDNITEDILLAVVANW